MASLRGSGRLGQRQRFPTCGHFLAYYKWYIDDSITVWVGYVASWVSFQQDLNKFGILRWDTRELALSVDFTDVTITPSLVVSQGSRRTRRR